MRENNYLGEFIQSYKPATLNIHRAVNFLFTSPTQFPQSAIIQQTKKFPDVSFYQEVINWETMRTKTDAAIIRAGQNLWVDEQFDLNWKEAKRVGIQRGVYWFYDDRIDPGRQADLLISLLKDDLPEMEVYADWERAYGGSFGGLANVVAFMQKVEAALPVKVAMYTGYYWFRDHSNAITNYSQYNYLKTKPLWLAWYAAAEVVIIPPPWSSLLLWQYGTPAIGSQYGVKTVEIDMNYFNGTQQDFERRYNLLSADTVTYPFIGVKQISGSRNGYRFWLQINDPTKVRYEVVQPPTISRLSTIAKARQADMGWNGSDYDRYTKIPTDRGGYAFIVLPDGKVEISIRRPADAKFIFSVRALISEGVIRSYLDGTESQYTEGHSRSIHGMDAQGNHMVLTSEGAYPNQGLTLKQCAEIMKQYGAVVAFDSGGGGDTTLFVDGEVLNTPEDIDGGIHVERYLPQVLLAFTQTGDNMGDYVKLKSNVATEWRSVRDATNYPTTPHIYGATDTTKRIQVGGFAEALIGDFYVYQTDVLVSGVTRAKAGDKWWKIYKANGVPMTGWVAEKHLGVTYLTVEEVIQTPPPTDEPVLKHTIEVYSDGSVKIDGNIIP